MSESISDQILRTVKKYRMLPPGSTVVVGFSGGADSTALLHWLTTYAPQLRVQVIAAHVNHGLRGEEAERDEQFVRSFCASRGILLRVLRVQVRQEAKKAGEGLEECGRRLRYTFFSQICKDYAGARIATAHTLSDQAETILLHFVRGAGAAGLAGISPVRGNIVRPLLEITRTQTEQYCRENGLAYVTDSSNADLSFARNRIRACVVPQLRRISPGFERAAARAARSLREDDDCLCGFAKEALQRAACAGGWRVQELAHWPRAVRMRALRLAARQAGVPLLDQMHLDLLDTMLTHGGGCTLSGAREARVEQGILLFPRRQTAYCVPLILPQTVLPDGRVFSVSVWSRAKFQQEKEKLHFSNCLNYDTITSDMVLRTRRNGDVFCPAGRGVTKTLKKLWNEQKVPPSLRQNLVLLTRGKELLWVEGCGPSEYAKVTPSVQKIAVVTVKECLQNGKPDAR